MNFLLNDSLGLRRVPPVSLLILLAFTPGISQAQEVAATSEEANIPSGSATPLVSALNDPGPLVPAKETNQIREYFAAVLAKPNGLTSSEAARAAARISPRARAASARVKAARAQKRELTWSYVPRLNFVGSYTKLSSQPATKGAATGGLVGTSAPPGLIDPQVDPLFAIDANEAFQVLTEQWYLGASLTIPLSDYVLSLSNALTGATLAEEAAKLNENSERVTAAANARIGYYTWVRAALEAREATQSVTRAEQQLATIKTQAAAGRTSRADVLRAQAFLAATELELRRGVTREAIAKEQLNVQMTGGKQAQPQWEIGEAIISSLEAEVAEASTLEQLQNEALSSRLEIQALRKNKTVFEKKANVEKTNAYPRLEGFGNAAYANPNQRIVPQVGNWLGSWDLGLRLSWTPNSLATQYAKAAQSQAEAEQIAAQISEIEFALRSEVLQEYRTLQESTLATNAAQRGLEASEAAYDDRIILFENGRATSLDLLEAENSLVRARLDLVAAYLSARISRVRLDHAIGRDIGPTLQGQKTKNSGR